MASLGSSVGRGCAFTVNLLQGRLPYATSNGRDSRGAPHRDTEATASTGKSRPSFLFRAASDPGLLQVRPRAMGPQRAPVRGCPSMAPAGRSLSANDRHLPLTTASLALAGCQRPTRGQRGLRLPALAGRLP